MRYLTLDEIIGTLNSRRPFKREEIKERRKLCLAYIHSKGIKHLTGKAAMAYIKKYIELPKVKKRIGVIHGSSAYLGRITGPVKIVNSLADMAKVNQGDVMVSIQTTPDLVPALKKAAAFVTDVGGITSHAAIVSREMKKPCIIGTQVATKILKDGDVVEVNANEGDVLIINK
jgi:phosphoenolpyruvate synthase/pyruvate phosphate dikinase